MMRATWVLKYLTGGLFLLTLMLGTKLRCLGVYADDTVVSDVSVSIPLSCNLVATVDTPHTARINAGTYQADIGTTTFKTTCNDHSGYSIYAIGYTNSEFGNTKLLATVNGTLAPTYDIVTGTNTSGTTSNWAMKLTPVTGTYAPTIENNYSDYNTVPSTYTKVATFPSSTDTVTGSSMQATYAAFIAIDQPAGTYNGKVKYTLVHPDIAPKPIACNKNATTIEQALCMQDFAGPNRDAIVASMTPEQQYTMKDSRDGKTYTIAKYQVGTDSQTSAPIYDVWMTKNLDLDLDASRTYTNLDTDLGYNTTTEQYETAAWSPARSTYTPTLDHIHEWCQGGTWNSQYGYCELNDTPESYDPGDLYWNLTESDFNDWDAYYSSCDFSTPAPTCDQSKNPISTYVSSTGTAQYHLGNYYNWAAALATNDSSAFNNDTLVEQSICPTGWTLPRIGDGEDTFYSLWNKYGFSSNSYNDTNNNGIHDANESALWTSPLYFAANGYFNGNLVYVGGAGSFWAPVPNGSGGAGGAYFDVDGHVDPSGGYNRGGGYSVRCILRPVVTSGSNGSNG